MKKLTFGVIIAIIIAIVAANRSGDNVGQNPEPTPTSSSFTVIVVNPDVLVKKGGETDFQKIAEKTEVAAGTEIKTSLTGKARILYPNGTVTDVEKDSHIKLEALDAQGNQSRIRVVAGGIWSKIKNVLGANEYYEVETENTVASVRGTIFSTEFRNKVTKVTGIENTVRVRAKNTTTNSIIPGADVDIQSGEETNVDDQAIAAKRLMKRALADADFRRDAIKQKIVEHIEREDLTKEQVRKIVRRAKEANLADRPFIQKLIERRLLEQDGSPVPTASASRTPTVSVTPKPLATMTPRPTPTPTPTPVIIQTPVPTPTPAPDTQPVLESVYPSVIKVNDQVALNGANFTAPNGTRQFSKVLIGSQQATTTFVDPLTIYVKTDGLYQGKYDVSLVTLEGKVLTLTGALTIQ